MEYFSTRNRNERVSAAEAVVRGIAADGGLYVPEAIPDLDVQALTDLCAKDYRARCAMVLGLFFTDFSDSEIREFVESAYGENFASPSVTPSVFLTVNTAMLELWHGPTCAFKDIALQILPRLMTASMKKMNETRDVCVLCATSGDTGKAALEGFCDVPGTKILVFYPESGVSEIQKLQMITQKGGNVHVCAVKGNFDDAQNGVKAIFGDKELENRLNEKGVMLSSANSINLGRLIPQIVYYISAYCDHVNSGAVKMGEKINVCVPTGNFGNILAAWYAKKMGVPIGRLICASNENNILTDFFDTGIYDKNRELHLTISPSMDILISSNLERLLFHLSDDDEYTARAMRSLADTGKYEINEKVRSLLASDFAAGYCSDEAALAEISRVFNEHGYLIDPHTAVALHVLNKYRGETGDDTVTVVASTANPYKFCESVLKALGTDYMESGAELLELMEEVTDTNVPPQLLESVSADIRFQDSAEKSGMRNALLNFLGI